MEVSLDDLIVSGMITLFFSDKAFPHSSVYIQTSYFLSLPTFCLSCFGLRTILGFPQMWTSRTP